MQATTINQQVFNWRLKALDAVVIILKWISKKRGVAQQQQDPAHDNQKRQLFNISMVIWPFNDQPLDNLYQDVPASKIKINSEQQGDWPMNNAKVISAKRCSDSTILNQKANTKSHQ